ncbi:hypothetical protein HZS_8061 [Henneguya salminicola]|nr:hypothetical protein HZS_8061 [Henneguya salminicola]
MFSTIEYGGFQYHKNSQTGSTKFYRCSKSRSYKCLARVIIDGEQVTEKGTHTCQKKVIISKKIENPYSLQNNILRISLKVNRTFYKYTPMRFIKNYSQV